MSCGHYFDAHPDVPSRPGEVHLALPDFQARLIVDRGVFSAGGIDPGTVELLRAAAPPPPGRRPARPRMRLRADRLHPGPPGPGRDGVGGRRQRSGPGAHRAATPPPSACPGCARPARRRSRLSVRFAAIWSNPPIRVGKAALHDLLTAGCRGWLPERGGLAGSAPASRCRLAGRLARRRGLAGDRGSASKRGYRILRVAPP